MATTTGMQGAGIEWGAAFATQGLIRREIDAYCVACIRETETRRSV